MTLNAQQSATTNRSGNIGRAFKSDILTFVLSRKRLKSVKWIKSYFILKMENGKWNK